jgi:hypothetical protein
VGKFIYGSQALEIEFDDRALAHVQMAMLSKLRRNESFSFSWHLDVAQGSGRHCLWISPALELHFEFSGGRAPALNRAWIKEMINAANDGELRILDEPRNDLPQPPQPR